MLHSAPIVILSLWKVFNQIFNMQPLN